MASVVVDTHGVIWYLLGDKALSTNAWETLEEAARLGDPAYVSSISLVEVLYLVEKGRLPGTALDRLSGALAQPDSGFVIAPLDMGVALAIRRVPRQIVPDMPDRIIAATALHLNIPLITRDREIPKAGVRTIW